MAKNPWKKRRRHSIISGLPEAVREEVEQMIKGDYTYAEITEWVKAAGYPISESSVQRYAVGLTADLQALTLVRENVGAIAEVTAQYPSMNITDAIIQMLSYQVFGAIRDVTDDEWGKLGPADLLRLSTTLTRTAAYKQRTDVQNMSALEAGYEQVKSAVFEAMGRDNPELYLQVLKFLDRKKSEGEAVNV